MNQFRKWLVANHVSENRAATALKSSQSALNRVARDRGVPTLEQAFLYSELARDDVPLASFLPYRVRRRLIARALRARRELGIDR